MQSNHATFEMAYTLSQSVDDSTPFIVMVGVPNKKSLEKVIRKLKDHQIDHSAFYEPDHDYGLTAVATVPLTEEQRAALRDYKLWKEENIVSGQSAISGEHVHLSGCQCSASPDAALSQCFSHAPVAQSGRAAVSKTDLDRAADFNRLVVGSNPTGRSSLHAGSSVLMEERRRRTTHRLEVCG